eukprot:TRINITY_DN5245_c0_g1_i2.p1 TRINITY_DN5245_c0_g1~~TRINITY_DN5245_c0_g1_i2.p1  ORF type:complete len:243 (+),score=74.40 TRINITY_DN5245_c0_g1_i2:64-792(+)
MGAKQLFKVFSTRPIHYLNLSRNKIFKETLDLKPNNITIFDGSCQFDHIYVELYRDRLKEFEMKSGLQIGTKKKRVSTDVRASPKPKPTAKLPAFLKKEPPHPQVIKTAIHETESKLEDLKKEMISKNSELQDLERRITQQNKLLEADGDERSILVQELVELSEKRKALRESNRELEANLMKIEKEIELLNNVLRASFSLVGWLQEEAEYVRTNGKQTIHELPVDLLVQLKKNFMRQTHPLE